MAEVSITQADNGTAVELRVGDTLHIRLPERPTTGYRWAVERVEPGLVPTGGSAAATAPDSRAGSAGERTFTFKAQQAGQTSLHLENRREWERGAPAAEEFDVTARITE